MIWPISLHTINDRFQAVICRLILYFNYLCFLDGACKLFALDVDPGHLVLGIAVDCDACPELLGGLVGAVVCNKYSVALTRFNTSCGETVCCTSARGKYLVNVQLGVTGICEDEMTLLYEVIPTEPAKVNCCLLELYVGFLCLCLQCECQGKGHEQYLSHIFIIYPICAQRYSFLVEQVYVILILTSFHFLYALYVLNLCDEFVELEPVVEHE